ncbi:MAG: helix-turn-helix domain-containing protein [Verrucomicrobiota bacterium]|nr:helix-turn-helix domain-containing protein [Verrucomicrobiota bacterium]
MSTVADQLRQSREAQNLTVYQVAETTKIRTDHIRALDEGQYDGFSAPVYIRGFVRTYATFLKLDVAKIMNELNEELSQTKKHSDDPPFTPKTKTMVDILMLQLSKLNWKIVVPILSLVIILGIVILGYRACKSPKTKDPLATLGPGLYQPSTNEGELLPLPKR